MIVPKDTSLKTVLLSALLPASNNKAGKKNPSAKLKGSCYEQPFLELLLNRDLFGSIGVTGNQFHKIGAIVEITKVDIFFSSR